MQVQTNIAARRLLVSLRKRKPSIAFYKNRTKGAIIMAKYISLIQFTDQGIRNIKDTIKRGDAAVAEAEKLGVKITDKFWTMGAYDVVVLFDAPDDETISAFTLKIGSLGKGKRHTISAFCPKEVGT